jgi:hypothetical protein
LQNNLYGVDLNEEAIEIARLSLWIKTAERDKALTSLDHTLRVGNSLVADPTVDGRAFDWQHAFPEVFAAGGFDVVVGNPPYVRQEALRSLKPYLEQTYHAYDGTADLYVYFYELGLRVLRPGGRLGFVVTNKWLKAGYGEPLRRLLAAESRVESVVDFGHAKQIFQDADVFPSLLVTRKPVPDEGPEGACRVCAIPREQLRVEDLARQIEATGFEVPRARFTHAAWSLEPPAVEALLEKLRHVGVPLKDFAGTRPLLGIKTGCNDAFFVDAATREELIRNDPKSTDLLRLCVGGEDIHRWRPAPAERWMIAMQSSGDHRWPWADAGDHAEAIFAQTYPAIHAHLNPYRDALTQRQDQGRFWWELRACAYWARFEQPKLLYKDLMSHPRLCLDESGLVADNTTYFLPAANLWVLAVLNSPTAWWLCWRKAQHGKDETLRYFKEFVEQLPIPRPTHGQQADAETLVRELAVCATQRHETTRSLLGWLRVETEIEKPSQKLLAPADLDETAFITEVKKLRGRSKPLSSPLLQALRDEYVRCVVPMQAQAADVTRLERQLSNLVNEAFGLTPEEVRLLWATAPPRMPTSPPAATQPAT